MQFGYKILSDFYQQLLLTLINKNKYFISNEGNVMGVGGKR